MRVAPAGLAGLSGGDPFTLGGQAAALTHGHPSGYLAAAAFAQMISDLVHGRNVADAADAAIGRLQAQGEAEVSAALAVAVYCALSAADFRSGVLLAVNHGGDSDSTGAICGNLLGARLGAGAIDSGLLDGLEGRKVITQVADDLYDVFACGREPSSQRYPA